MSDNSLTLQKTEYMHKTQRYGSQFTVAAFMSQWYAIFQRYDLRLA